MKDILDRENKKIDVADIKDNLEIVTLSDVTYVVVLAVHKVAKKNSLQTIEVFQRYISFKIFKELNIRIRGKNRLLTV